MAPRRQDFAVSICDHIFYMTVLCRRMLPPLVANQEARGMHRRIFSGERLATLGILMASWLAIFHMTIERLLRETQLLSMILGVTKPQLLLDK